MSSSSSVRGGGDRGEGKSNDETIAKAVGFFVFSGIAISVIKGLIPKRVQARRPPPPHDLYEFPAQNLKFEERLGSGSSSNRIVEIAKGDTLWGLATRYGVSVDAIKEANEMSGDTIYAGKKLVIP
ncbi:uncharacterized protein [Typha angustifolia]|uniref:uncharacterized protein isoform X1 n=1 Tax=Typha angustifolia TaxID=59011 RepID=UPI003C2B453B